MDNRDMQILKKIILYCERIQENLERFEDNIDTFLTDYMLQDACCMCIVQIGELAGVLSDQVKDLNRSIPWRAIKDTRNLYVHAYGSVDLDMVWNTMHEDIPQLKAACEDLLRV